MYLQCLSYLIVIVSYFVIACIFSFAYWAKTFGNVIMHLLDLTSRKTTFLAVPPTPSMGPSPFFIKSFQAFLRVKGSLQEKTPRTKLRRTSITPIIKLPERKIILIFLLDEIYDLNARRIWPWMIRRLYNHNDWFSYQSIIFAAQVEASSKKRKCG